MLSHPLLVFQVLLLLHFVLFLLFDTCTGSVDPKFEACVPKTCGNGQNITYPFYILDKQEPFCGYPGFDLTCDNNGFPIFPKHDNEKYVVEEIFYANHSLRVSILFSKPTSTECFPPPVHSFSNDSRFRVTPNQKRAFLFYYCNLKSLKEHRIECPVQNQTSSVVALYEGDPNLGLAMKHCNNKVVRATVEDDKRGIVEGLRRGFVLNWTASSCEECSGSGGRCGFDYGKDAYAFRCYCRDGVHFEKCDPKSQPQSGWLLYFSYQFLVCKSSAQQYAALILANRE
ncbi:hypothetical protein RIF29_16387 [Crotalaria pallida]|uniref:non-specific serine/threonine protein kinase n=1 Tax=Crotalaria pallida TaxID=3830 RepID=A0AAN9IJS7_CROPI